MTPLGEAHRSDVADGNSGRLHGPVVSAIDLAAWWFGGLVGSAAAGGLLEGRLMTTSELLLYTIAFCGIALLAAIVRRFLASCRHRKTSGS